MSVDLKAEYIREWSLEDCDTPGYRFDITRRELGALGIGMVFALVRPGVAGAEEETIARIHVSEDGVVTLLTGKVELGQGSRTILTQVVAEEMRVPPARVRVVMGDTDVVPDDGGTWGSLTTPGTVPAVRKAAVEARKALQKFAAGIAPIPPAEWKVCGTSLPPISGREVVTGGVKYASDRKAAGMLHARVVRAPGYRAKLGKFEAPAGIRAVRDGELLGVLANEAETAREHAKAVRGEWAVEPLPERSEMFARFQTKSTPPKPAEGGRYPALITGGNVSEGLAACDRKLEATYTLPNLAQVPLEPRAAIAEWKEGRLTVWSGTQAPFLVRKELATAFRIPETQVRVIAVDTGSGYGGKQRGECETEAARLAKDAGAPVRLTWSREEEFTASYCRPAGVLHLQAGLDEGGRIHAWQHKNYNSGAASLTAPYRIPHLSCEYHRSESPLRQGSFRSLAGVANTFAREMHVEALAALAGSDPLEFRLNNIEDERLKTVLQRAAERFHWTGSKTCGLACNLEKDGRFALFAEMDEIPRVARMVLAMDVGAILNPDGLRNQAEGALVQGIGGALFEELKFDQTRITNARFSAYRVPRFADLPKIEVILIDRREIESAGAGEAPITVVAPAIGAALARMTGRVFRSLPLMTEFSAKV